ncbi:MAG: Diamine N-acetyltransferase [Bacteroidetes bacterium]|nr:Diamine N-acetyltransferase [Bacteroidota bacterium]
MDILIRKAEARDVADIMLLIRELAAFERAPDAVLNTEEEMLRDGFGEQPSFEAFVAEVKDTGEVVGVSLFHWAYSTWKGKYMYLDDLYVKEKMRGQSVGKMLLEAFLQYAQEQGANLVKWQVLNWNEPAIQFYKKYDVTFDNEWIDCKIYYPKP